MPRGSKPGERRGGRTKGVVNRNILDVREKLARIGHDPIIGMATIAMNELPCGVCRGTGKTLYKKPLKPFSKCPNCGFQPEKAIVHCGKCDYEEPPELAPRICMSCYGTLMEACSPNLRGQMNAELAQYVEAKRKALEISGSLSVSLAEVVRQRRELRLAQSAAQ